MLILIKKVLETIKKYNMLKKGEKVIVGVSGGPDSMCLLHLLTEIRGEFDLNLVAAHVNHSIRGQDADDDAEYVRNFCMENDIEFAYIKVDVRKIAAEGNSSEETAGRDVRYQFFEKLKRDFNADKIAIAHNLNDQAETVLMRILRGTGLEGLAGIKPVRDKVYIRPLLFCSRGEIEEYCRIHNLHPRMDKTNYESVYIRNKVRLELIPYIEKNFNRDIINTLSRLAQNAEVDSEYLQMETENKYKKYCVHKDYKVIISKEAFSEHEAIVTRIIRQALKNISGELKNIERQHIFQIINLQRTGTGRKLMFPNNISVFNNYGDLHIFIESKIPETNIGFYEDNKREYKLSIGTNSINEIGLKVTAEICSAQDTNAGRNKDPYTAYFDYEKINGDITLRFRKPGDKFKPLGVNGTKKIKDIFIDLKIPRELRDKIPLICFGGEIAWITGYKMGSTFKIDKNTKEILKIKVEREDS